MPLVDVCLIGYYLSKICSQWTSFPSQPPTSMSRSPIAHGGAPRSSISTIAHRLSFLAQFAASLAWAKLSSGNSVLVVLEKDFQREQFSMFFQSLKGALLAVAGGRRRHAISLSCRMRIPAHVPSAKGEESRRSRHRSPTILVRRSFSRQQQNVRLSSPLTSK